MARNHNSVVDDQIDIMNLEQQLWKWKREGKVDDPGPFGFSDHMRWLLGADQLYHLLALEQRRLIEMLLGPYGFTIYKMIVARKSASKKRG